MAGVHQEPQWNNTDGKPYPAAKLYFYEADSLIPLTVYRDYGLGVVAPNPMEADANGAFVAAFLDEADEFYKIRTTTAAGVIIRDLTVLPIIGPSGGGGGGGTPTDPDTLMKTGDTKWRLETGVHSGWVRVNGRTIGSATSGATERANADTQALFELIWNNFDDTLSPVSGGRGANAAADFAANKTITLPDARGRVMSGLDDMGNTPAGRLTGATIPGGAITLGNAGGDETVAIAPSNLPAIGVSFTTDADGEHGHETRVSTRNNAESDPTGGMLIDTQEVASYPAHSGAASDTPGEQVGGTGSAHTHSGTTDNLGSGAAVDKIQPTLLTTLYVKL